MATPSPGTVGGRGALEEGGVLAVLARATSLGSAAVMPPQVPTRCRRPRCGPPHAAAVLLLAAAAVAASPVDAAAGAPTPDFDATRSHAAPESERSRAVPESERSGATDASLRRAALRFAERPGGFETLAGHAVSRRVSARRITVHAGDARHAGDLERAVALWNEAAREAGIPAPFRATRRREEARIVLSWAPCAPGRAGATTTQLFPAGRDGEDERRWPRLEIQRLLLDADLPPDDPRTVEVIAHELGHVLGLGHSADPRDLMHDGVASSRRGAALPPRPSRRDVVMLGWLHRRPLEIAVTLGASLANEGLENPLSVEGASHQP